MENICSTWNWKGLFLIQGQGYGAYFYVGIIIHSCGGRIITIVINPFLIHSLLKLPLKFGSFNADKIKTMQDLESEFFPAETKLLWTIDVLVTWTHP